MAVQFSNGDLLNKPRHCIYYTFICIILLQPGETALHVAARNGRIDAVKVLLAAGINVSLKNKVYLQQMGVMIST